MKEYKCENNGIDTSVSFGSYKRYQVETKRVNKTEKNNLEKFPERFTWVITNEETKMFQGRKFRP